MTVSLKQQTEDKIRYDTTRYDSVTIRKDKIHVRYDTIRCDTMR